MFLTKFPPSTLYTSIMSFWREPVWIKGKELRHLYLQLCISATLTMLIIYFSDPVESSEAY